MAHRPNDTSGGSELDRRSRALFEDLASSLPAGGRTMDVVVGLHWTAVVCQRSGLLQCGLASTVVREHGHGEAADVPEAGQLEQRPPRELAKMFAASSPTERAIGLAAINACLPQGSADWVPMNAGEAIARLGGGKRVALVGHFPFIPQLRQTVGELFVLEQQPERGDLPAEAAGEVLPRCTVVALTAMTLLNGTYGQLMELAPAEATVMLLGPSAPLSPLLFDHGLDVIAGTHVHRVEPVAKAIRQGANYRQIHRLGTRLVTIAKAGFEIP